MDKEFPKNYPQPVLSFVDVKIDDKFQKQSFLLLYINQSNY